MIDLHSHFLFGVDDGARDIDATFKMLHQAEEVGITKLLATPHINEQTDLNSIQHIQHIFSKVKQRIKQENMNIDIKLAAELEYGMELVKVTRQSWVLIGKKSRYLLFELPLFNMPLNILDVLFQLRVKNVIPIIAHPERNVQIQKNFKILYEYLKQGCLIQINAGSVVGNFGKTCQRICHHLLEEQAIHFIGSDAHDIRNRGYQVFLTAYHYMLKKYGEEYINSLFYHNPDKVWYGEPLTEKNDDNLHRKISQKILRKINFIR
jgi:protein-tyrosine phosphatase